MPIEADAPVCVQIAASPIVGWGCSIPVGGIIGLAVSLYGYTYMNAGLEGFSDALEDMGAEGGLGPVLTGLNYGIYLIVIANALVMLYGFREKCRIRNDILGHITFCCLPGVIKFFVKTAIHLVVSAALVGCLILGAVMEAIYVLFLAMDAICGSDSMDTVGTIMDLMPGKNDNPFDEICDAVSDGLASTGQVSIGAALLVAAEIIVICYWYKYSTLAMVTPFYGKDSKYDTRNITKKKDEAKAKVAAVADAKQAKVDAKLAKNTKADTSKAPKKGAPARSGDRFAEEEGSI